MRALATAFRAFAHRHPAAYSLLFARLPQDARVDPGWIIKASAPVLAAAERLAGTDQALDAARTVVAWANGFITMELAGGFRLGGDIDRAFDYGIDRLAAAIAVDGPKGPSSTGRLSG